MKTAFQKLWRTLTRPVYRLEFTLLTFGLVAFQYFWFGSESAFYYTFKEDYRLPLLFYFYTPLIVVFSFLPVPSLFSKLWRIAAFACTLMGIVIIEMSSIESIRKPSFFEVFYHAVIILQILIIVINLIQSLRKSGDIDGTIGMDLKPDYALNLVVISWVVIATLGFAPFASDQMYKVGQYALFGGVCILWVWNWLMKRHG